MYYLNIQQLKFQVFLMSLLLKLAALFIYEMIGADKLKKGIVFLSGIFLVGTVKGVKNLCRQKANLLLQFQYQSIYEEGSNG